MITWEGGEEPVRLMLKEGLRHKWRLVLGFVLICSAGVALGLLWPKAYASSVTISLEHENIIDSLMQGRAVRTEVQGPPQNAGDMALGRSLLLRALQESGQVDEDTPAQTRDRLMVDLRERTEITMPGENLITIHYRGPGPEAAQNMTARLGQLFIEETLKGKERESDAAFQFIDRQVKQYEQQMARIQERIEKLRAEHPVAEPGAADRLAERETALTQQTRDLEQQIREARIREESLQTRLSEQPAPGSGASGGQAAPSRLAQLRSELATLRLNYHDSYPDIVRIKRQIKQLEQQGAAEGPRLAQGGPAGGTSSESPPAGAAPAAGDPAQSNPPAGGAGESPAVAALGASLYPALQQDLYNTRTEIQALQSRLQSVNSQLATVRDKQGALEGVQGRINDLERDYAVNRNIYEDLLGRRENARVSRDMGSAEKGLTIRVQEPAHLPTSPENPQPLHFAVAGGVLGAGVPIGLLFLVVMLDPRIRDVAHVPVETGSVLLTTIPHARTRFERRTAPLGVIACVLVVIATVVSLAALMWVQTNNVL